MKVYVDGIYTTRTTIVKGTLKPVWGETLTMYVACFIIMCIMLIWHFCSSSTAESALLTMEVNHESSCFGFVKTTVGSLLRLCEQSPSKPLELSWGKNAHVRTVTQLQLQQRTKNKAVVHNVPGLMSLGIMAIDSGQARKIVLSTAQQDSHHGLDGQDKPGDSNLEAALVSNSENVFESLGAALDKIQVIANVAANAAGEIAKVGYLQ